MAEDKTKIKKKKWVEIAAPKLFKEQPLGEISLENPESAVGRIIKANLMNLIGDMKKQNTEVGFKITQIKENKAITESVSYKIVASSTKRLVRRGKEKIEMTLNAVTADGKHIVIKPFFITRFAVKKSILTSLRRAAKQILTDKIKKLKFEQVISEMVSNRLQKTLYVELKKIYPLKISEIRGVKVVKIDKKAAEAPVKEDKKAEEAPKKEEKKAEAKETPKTEEKKSEEKPMEEQKDKPKEVKEEKGDTDAKTNN